MVIPFWTHVLGGFDWFDTYFTFYPSSSLKRYSARIFFFFLISVTLEKKKKQLLLSLHVHERKWWCENPAQTFTLECRFLSQREGHTYVPGSLQFLFAY